MSIKIGAFVHVAFAAATLVFSANVFAQSATPAKPEGPSKGELCVVDLEATISAQKSATGLTEKQIEEFDGIIGQALQLCDKKDYDEARNMMKKAKQVIGVM